MGIPFLEVTHMRIHHVMLVAALAAGGCKKTGGGGGGGGGGGWFVGSRGLMANVDAHGVLGAGYDLGESEELLGIACRYKGEAWVAGTHGTLLYTNDGGRSWSAQAVPLTGDLRAVATQDFGPVFLAGDDGIAMTNDTGATWQLVADRLSFRSIAAAHEAPAALALASDGGLWSFDGHGFVQGQRIPGARTVAVSDDGGLAMIAGDGLLRSEDGGKTWRQLAVEPGITFEDIRLTEDGGAIAVGTSGAIANVDSDGNVTVQHVGTANLHALHIADDDAPDANGYAAGDGGQTYVTRDFGATWELGPALGETVWGVDEIGDNHR
jgi:photosystem II stability/assembly factor-like uncharacterized protein